MAPESNSKTGASLFYRLPGENDSDSTWAGSGMPNEGKLRPDTKGYQYTVKSMSQEERDEESGDEIPLHGIRVETDTMVFERSTI